MIFKPTLAVEAEFSKIQYPVFGSPKLDGIRCSIVEGKALTRSLKAIPNKHVSEFLSKREYSGLDGELIVGSPTSPTVYRDSVSNIMAHDKVPNFHYYVFDIHDSLHPYERRLQELQDRLSQMGSTFQLLEQRFIMNEDDMLAYEAAMVAEGYEGLILRSPTAPYKYGRSTVKEGYLLKVKRFVDSEAEIIGFEEEMFNGNEAQTNELGRTKRSTAKSGLQGKATLGALQVRDCTTHVEFAIGTGLTAAERQHFWNRQNDFRGKLVKYKSFLVGVKDKPRHPVYLGMRDAADL